ncbi:2-amino-4-hydroxy-6-hydroxymethyldihydropteridine diphosphokinase [Rubinisphaera italica]|uniref:2-amino-4-hydroxy-6-hydroxymethyldihydropteridine pyrophosphokinase n=1 Tax=Rubinisphaera italica TaxID=2527969 RepID=A0A5C5XMJ0_9PLAN|nr:2-amino-4-hydroxy-6-hydroxymethyldihydropteridine diphosphokinase [Rubinisphaera italica]TWT63789.1 Bifunctional folate synthesis protein [Rubinisphaera italica]
MIAGIALGGNLGDTAQIIQTVLHQLDANDSISVLKQSRLYETTAVGEKAGNRFLNATALIETSLQPIALLDVCQKLETDSGRTREIHWGPRTIDLDLIFCDQIILRSERLNLPHPACWYRRFVLDPLCDVAAEFVNPVFGKTFAELRQRLLSRPLCVDLSRLETSRQQVLQETLRNVFGMHQLELITSSTLLLSSDRNSSSAATWILLTNEQEGIRESGGLFEWELPGTFEVSMADVVHAGLDQPVCLVTE